MRSKLLTASGLALCCLFVGGSARADLVGGSLKIDAPFTYACGRDCADNVRSFYAWTDPLIAGSWEPRATYYYDMRSLERQDSSDVLGDYFFARRDHGRHDPITVPPGLEGEPSTPVSTPEPSSLLLTGLGLIGLALARTGFRRKQSLPREATS